jgi:hypothetical protein
MSKTISVRLDGEALRALRLLESSGMTRSAAIRTALIESASAIRRSEALRAEVERLNANEADRRETEAVQAFMEELGEPG